MLRAVDLHAGYGDVEVIHDVSIAVGQDEVVALIGSNGAGKTTLLKAITGIVRPSRGRVEFRGKDIGQLPPHLLVSYGIVRVPEGRKIFPRLTVRDNLALGAYHAAARVVAQTTEECVLRLFPALQACLHQAAGSLSGGEQQMLALGRALMTLPQLLILDEPSSGLSPLMVDNLFAAIRTIHEGGVSVLLVEQNVALALELADRGYVLENGHIVLEDRGANLLRNPRVREAYLGV